LTTTCASTSIKRTYEHTASLHIEHNLFVGAGAVEFILCHAEVEIAFAEEKKIELLLKTLPKSNEFLKSKSIYP